MKDLPSSQCHQYTNRDLGPRIDFKIPKNETWHNGIYPIRDTSYGRICVCDCNQEVKVDTFAMCAGELCPEEGRRSTLKDEQEEEKETVDFHDGDCGPKDDTMEPDLGDSNEVDAD